MLILLAGLARVARRVQYREVSNRSARTPGPKPPSRYLARGVEAYRVVVPRRFCGGYFSDRDRQDASLGTPWSVRDSQVSTTHTVARSNQEPIRTRNGVFGDQPCAPCVGNRETCSIGSGSIPRATMLRLHLPKRGLEFPPARACSYRHVAMCERLIYRFASPPW